MLIFYWVTQVLFQSSNQSVFLLIIHFILDTMILIVNCVLQKCLRVVENMGNGVGTENSKKDNTNSINGKLENNETSNSKPNDDKDKSNSDDKDNTNVCENNSIDSSETNKDKERENENQKERSPTATQEPRA